MTKPKTIREWMVRAQKEHWAIGAFNVGNLETMHAVLRAAKRLHSPVILETSPGETTFMEMDDMIALVKTNRTDYDIPIFLNLDHATKEQDVVKALKAGYDLLHFDGGEMPYWKNKKIAKRLARAVHKRGKILEAEIDHITGSSGVHTGSTKKALSQGQLTDPDQAAAFVRETGCDTFAAFIGNVHGLYTTPKKLDFDRLKAVRQKTSCFLSLHGGSGISNEQIKKAIRYGITKVNINTEMRVAFRKNLEKQLKKDKSEAMYKVMPPVVEAVEKVVTEKIKLFGSRGKA